MEKETSYSRMRSQICSHMSYMMFSRLCTSIHLARSDPPRLTMPMRRFLTNLRWPLRTPAWMVK